MPPQGAHPYYMDNPYYGQQAGVGPHPGMRQGGEWNGPTTSNPYGGGGGGGHPMGGQTEGGGNDNDRMRQHAQVDIEIER